MKEAVIPKAVIDYLNELYPSRDDFSHSVTHEALVYYLGQRSVVRFLENKYREQNETLITKD